MRAARPGFAGWGALALLAGCGGYSCGVADVVGGRLGEWCGPGGSIGELYVDEELVYLSLNPDGATGTPAGDHDSAYLPAFSVSFHRLYLDEPGTTLTGAQAVGWCHRILVPGDSTYATWPLEDLSITIGSASNRRSVGGLSWNLAWEVGCSAAQMSFVGDDVVELHLKAGGYDWELYGRPPAHPQAAP